MGYGTRPNRLGGDIRTYWPDDTEDTMYIEGITCPTLADLLNKAQEKWPGITPDKIQISGEKIHTDCLGYDLYDPTDWTDFIILTKTE